MRGEVGDPRVDLLKSPHDVVRVGAGSALGWGLSWRADQGGSAASPEGHDPALGARLLEAPAARALIDLAQLGVEVRGEALS